MLKALLAAILVALVIVILLLIPAARPDRRVAVDSTPSAPSNFVIHNDAPPTPTLPSKPAPPAGFVINDATPSAPAATAPVTPPAAAPDPLDTAIQRLRAGKPDATVTVTPAPAAASPPAAAPVAAPRLAAQTSSPLPSPAPSPAPPARWTNVTGQGVQFRITPTGDGFMISIDLGGGQVAEVHAAPAFGHLDPAAINTRVDYLKQTILTEFPVGSGSYLFNRDGSVTRGR